MYRHVTVSELRADPLAGLRVRSAGADQGHTNADGGNSEKRGDHSENSERQSEGEQDQNRTYNDQPDAHGTIVRRGLHFPPAGSHERDSDSFAVEKLHHSLGRMISAVHEVPPVRAVITT
jgi:hypothetical protein